MNPPDGRIAAEIGLVDMPAEVLSAISGFLMEPHDLVAWTTVTGLPVADRLVRIVLAQEKHHVGNLLRRRAPLGVVSALLALAGKSQLSALLPAATSGGRVDVVEWICTAIIDRSASVAPHGADNRKRLSALRPNILIVDRVYDGTARYMLEALRVASDAGRAHLIGCLLTNCPCDRAFLPDASLDRIATLAVMRGDADTVRAVHNFRKKGANGRSCTCDREIGQCALKADQVAVVEALHDMRCAAACTVARGDLDRAIQAGSVGVARWLVGTTTTTTTASLRPHVRESSVNVAAAGGFTSMVAFVHDSGLLACSGRVLASAAAAGRRGVLEWAVGESTQAAGRDRPIDAWYDDGTRIAHAAVAHGHTGIIVWMAKRADASRTLSVGVARAALTEGMLEAAVALHDARVAPFDTWDALLTAVCLGDQDIAVRTVAQHSARCNGETLRKALRKAHPCTLAYLRDRYEISDADLQEAVDRVAGLPLRDSTVVWIRDNVPGVCVKALAERDYGGLLLPPQEEGVAFSCTCVRCAPVS
ncbi:MAG TPA: hypothetical protein VIO38_08095 [Rariglobus sp.]